MVRRTHIFIDKVNITIPVPRADWDRCIENFLHLDHRDFNLRLLQNPRGYRHYNFHWSAMISGRGHKRVKCFVHAAPFKESNNFLKLEWNPAKAAPNAIIEIHQLIKRCIPRFRRCWRRARITRADVTFDVLRLNIEEVFAFTGSARPEGDTFDQNPERRLNGYRIGEGTSNNRLVIYDKLFHCTRGVNPNQSKFAERTRFEFRLRGLGPLAKVQSFKNGLSKYSIISVNRAIDLREGRDWQRFISDCLYRGAQKALKQIDSNRRKEYRKILKSQCTPTWYDQKVLWEEARDAILCSLTP